MVLHESTFHKKYRAQIMKAFFSLASGIMFLIAFIPYAAAVWKDRRLPSGTLGKAEPSKVSWLIWAVLDVIALQGMHAKNAVNGQIVDAVSGAGVMTIMAFKYGNKSWDKIDVFCLVGAAVGFVMIFINPEYAIITSAITGLIGSISTFTSAWKDPGKENKLAWTLFWTSCLMAMIAIPKWTIADVVQPLTFTLIESTMMVILFVPRQQRADPVAIPSVLERKYHVS
jgi:hypothetical protein